MVEVRFKYNQSQPFPSPLYLLHATRGKQEIALAIKKATFPKEINGFEEIQSEAFQNLVNEVLNDLKE